MTVAIDPRRTQFTTTPKQGARYERIIKPVCQYYSSNRLPSALEYWTLAGPCAAEDGSVFVGSEYEHLVWREQFVRPEQFWSVELHPDTHAWNSKAFPRAHWVLGDLVDFVRESVRVRKAVPGVLHADFTRTPYTEIERIGMLIDYLNELKHPPLLIVNLAVRAKSRKYGKDTICQLLKTHPVSRAAFRRRSWRIVDDSLRYWGGTETSKVTMQMDILYCPK